jgi:hypothetical protein
VRRFGRAREKGNDRRRSWAVACGCALLLVQALGVADASAASGTTVTVIEAPAAPIVANTTATFAAQISPAAAGRTIAWEVNGGIAGESTTDASGTASVGLAFGPGGYLIIAILEPVDGQDQSWATSFELMVTPDPSRLPDLFMAEQPDLGTIGAEGSDAQISVSRPVQDASTLSITANNTVTNDTMRVMLKAPAGGTLVPGVYRSDGWFLTLATGCGSGSVTDFDILSMERDPAGVPIAFAITFSYLCNDATWPIVGAIRYNSTTAIPLLSNLSGNPNVPAAIEGHTGLPATFGLSNTGEVPVHVGTIALAGTNAAAFSRTSDTCSGSSLAPGASCVFDLTFRPSSPGEKSATIDIPSDIGLSPLHFNVSSFGAMTEGVSQPVVHGDDVYFVPGIRYTATVSPTPIGNPSECIVDGVHVDGSLPGPHGEVDCITARPAPGQHSVAIHYLGSPENGESTSPTTLFTIDPTTSTTLTSSVSSTRSDKAVKLAAMVAFRGDVTYDGGTLTITDETTSEVVASGPVGPGAPSLTLTRTFAAGPHHLVAAYSGTAGEDASAGPAIDLTIAAAPPDVTRPTVTTPVTHPIGAGTSLVSGTVPTKVSFSGADVGSGIDHFVLYQATDGGALVAIESNLKTQYLELDLRFGHAYRFAVKAVDRAGNSSSLAVGGPFHLTAVSQSAGAVHYHGSWANSTSSLWWGGTARCSTSAGASATFTFTGRSIAWVGLKAANRGRALVYVNGVLKATVYLYSASTLAQRIVWSANYTTSATRTVTIKVLATPGSPRIDLDGFIVGS